MVSLQFCLGVRHPSGSHDKIVISVVQLADLLVFGALSDEKTSLWFTFAAGPCQCSPWVQVLQDSLSYLFASNLRLLNLEGQVPIFIFHRNRVTQLYSQALGLSNSKGVLLQLTVSLCWYVGPMIRFYCQTIADLYTLQKVSHVVTDG
jgi:hypothetical protein